LGDHLPDNLSAEALALINADTDAFMCRVNECAYARARLTSGGEETAEPSDALGYVVVEHWEHPHGTKWSLTRNVIHSTYDGAVNAKPSDFTNFYGRRFTYTVARVTPAPTEEPT
jgi:hypothetical protein